MVLSISLYSMLFESQLRLCFPKRYLRFCYSLSRPITFPATQIFHNHHFNAITNNKEGYFIDSRSMQHFVGNGRYDGSNEELLEKMKDAVLHNGDDILQFLRTQRCGRILDPHVISLLKDAEHFAGLHGLLLCDVKWDDLRVHILGSNNLRSLFSPKFIREQRFQLYGENELPLLQDAGCNTPSKDYDTKGINDDLITNNVVSWKRQVLIERRSFAEAVQSAREDASNLLELQKPSDLPALSATCEQWVSDLANFIEKHMDGKAANVLPPLLDSQTLASATVKMALQLMCFPAYASDSKGQRGGLMRRRSQQTAGNQVLLAHAAVRLGDEIGRIYARKVVKHPQAEQAPQQEKIVKHDRTAESVPIQSTTNSTGFASRVLCSLNITSKFGASQARVISNTGVNIDHVCNLNDETYLNEPKQWNNRQSAAVGGYLLHALVKSCFIEVDLATALRQLDCLPDVNNTFMDQKYKKKGDAFISLRKPRFDEAKVQIPAFAHRILRMGVKTYGVLEMKECCMLKIRDAVARSLVCLSCLPMVCEPKPWTSVSSGGLTILRHYFIRTHSKPTFDVRVHDLTNILEVASGFGKVPWRINTRVLDTLEKIWYSCSGWEDDVNNASMKRLLPSKDIDDHLSTMERANLLSEASLFERRLKIAHDFKMEPRIYFPQNIDFRGRMYPLSPHLNHMADDTCRGLLQFAKRERLGKRGFFWLQVHVANLYGIDKVPFRDRISWVHTNLELIRLLVKNPFNQVTQSFWCRAEAPFQFYAACIEMTDAIDSGNPYEYLSCIPIHQDGSCNGLQHYAALGRDLKGGNAVNLIPGDAPQDVYQQVLVEVLHKTRLDYADDSPPNKRKLARKCLEMGLLKRKIVKQTVMTICYGVTRIGAVAQIEQRLKEIPALEQEQHKVIQDLSKYIAGQIMGSIKTFFSEAMSIKRWLDGISSAHNMLNIPVVWQSPIGLPCEQPYCKTTTRVIRTPIQAINIRETSSSTVDKRKQKLAFPPNFVHSLDASHLMKTAQEMFKTSKSFAAVHDSYWTHASHVDEMNVIIRKTFVDMYQQPILEQLQRSCNARLAYNKTIIPPPPNRGSLDITSVLESTYFFH